MIHRQPWSYAPRIPFPLPSPSEPLTDFLLAAASQAPSGDNCQPWRFRVRDDRIDLFLVPEVDPSFFNVDQIASIIACGFAIENMCIAATAAGHQAQVELLPEGPDANLMATLSTAPADVTSSPLIQAIWVRNTNRKPYRRTPVPYPDLDALERAARGDGSEETTLQLVTDRDALREVGRLIFSVDRIRTEHRGLHEHFMNMVRFTQEDAMRTLDGLPLPNLEAGKPGDAFLKMTKPWFVMEKMGKVGAGHFIALVSRLGILNSAGVGLIAAGGPRGRASALAGGRALARTWLTATRLGLRIQPMTAITLFWERWKRGGEKDFSPRHRKMLEDLWPGFRSLFSIPADDDRTQIMLFRFGFAPDIFYGTYRKPVDQVMRTS